MYKSLELTSCKSAQAFFRLECWAGLERKTLDVSPTEVELAVVTLLLETTSALRQKKTECWSHIFTIVGAVHLFIINEFRIIFTSMLHIQP